MGVFGLMLLIILVDLKKKIRLLALVDKIAILGQPPGKKQHRRGTTHNR